MSLPEQRDAIIRYAGRQSLTITEWFEEQQTAAKSGRPVWNRMLKLLRGGKARGVIIHKIDRSARNLHDWADLGELTDGGVEVHFASESLDLHSRSGRLSADIQAVVAADYIRNLREEAKKGIYGRLKQGFYPLPAPLGYCDHGSGKSKTIHPEKGPLVAKAFELYASGRFSIISLGEELYRLGLRNRKGGRVSRNALAEMLHNTFYIGLIRIQTNGETYPGNHEPLISKRLFDVVQDGLRGRFHTRTKSHQFVFRRLITCKDCGYTLVGEERKGHVYYRCHTKDCPTTSVREERITSAVETALQGIRFDTPQAKLVLEQAIRRLKQNWAEEAERQLAMLNARLQQVTERLNRLTDAYLDQVVDRALYGERKTALLLERRAIDDEIKYRTDHPNDFVTIGKFLGLAGSLYLAYGMANPIRKRQLLKIISSDVSVHDKSLGFTFVLPFREINSRLHAQDGGPSKGLDRTIDELITSLIPQNEACAAIVTALEEDTAQ